MKRETPPKEVWLYRSEGRWSFSFDPPRKRYAKRFHRMVPATDAEVKRLRRALSGATESLRQAAGIFDAENAPRTSARFYDDARKYFAALKPQVTRERKRR